MSDASDWKEGEGGFGAAGTPGSFPNTEWKTPDIWLRSQFALTTDEVSAEGQLDSSPIRLNVYHDEDAEIYLNGVLALKLKGFSTEYQEFELSPEAVAELRAGNNVIAVHCHQTTGGQGIDVGIVALLPESRGK